jgi:alanine-glyoxylate transaminase/serine-glyoxylate transaminase/serine-pyruvate transaminase
LAQIYGSRNEVVIVPATGRGGVEAAVSSVVEPGEVVVMAVNGVFGRMMAAITERTGAEVVTVESPPGEPVDFEGLEDVCRTRAVRLMGCVHNESSTGVLNDIDEFARIGRACGALTMVDVVSSLGGAEISADDRGIDLCVGATQKCLHAPTGLAPVAVSERAWETMAGRRTRSGSFYFDLLRWRRMFIAKERGGEEMYGYRRAPWSLPIYLFYALHEAVLMVLEEGLAARIGRHEDVARATRAAVGALGLTLFPQPGIESPTVTAFHGPQGVAVADFLRLMRRKYRVAIGGGLEELRGKMARIGHMGVVADPVPLRTTICALGCSLRELGVDADLEGALRAFGD